MRTLALVLLLMVPGLAGAQVAKVLTPAEAQAAFRVANDACLKDDLKTCIEGYEGLLEAGYAGADLEFNLGTAYLKQGRAGSAVLHLERALRLDPSDSDARANLERAQRLRVDKLVGAPEETGGEEPLASRIVSHTNGDRWSLAFLVLWTLGALSLLGRRFLSSPGKRALALVGGLLLVTASVPAGSSPPSTRTCASTPTTRSSSPPACPCAKARATPTSPPSRSTRA
ncbi:MAG: hypothetical protein QM765_19435 [Myxococcales bacterium]